MPRDFQALMDWLDTNNCTQGDLAKMIGVSQGHLSAILTGKRQFTLEQSIRASVITGLGADKLCTDAEALRILKIYVIRNKQAA